MTAAGNHAGNVRSTAQAARRATTVDHGSSERPRLVRALTPLPSAFVLGAALALFAVVGESFAETGSIDGMTANMALTLVRWCAFALALGELASMAFRALDVLNDSIARGTRARSRAGSSALPGAHPFALCAVILVVCWLPFFIVYFPGSLPYDGVRSLNQFVAGAPLENHHPVLMNMLYAVLYQAGTAAGTALGQDVSSVLSPDNLGVFAIVSFQTAVCVLAFSGVVRFVDRSNTPAAFAWVTLGFFALFPAWGVFAQDAFKDTLFNGVFALFVLVCGWILLPIARPAVFARSGIERNRGAEVRTSGRTAADDGGSELTLWALLFFVGILVCLTRNNGVYLVAPTLLLVCVFARSKQAVAVLVGALALYVGVTSFLWPAIGVDMKGNSKETLSIPFQQTARYVATHPDDVTDEEHAAIDAVLPYDQLAELYMPDLSDPVKESFKLNNSKIEGSTEYAEEHPDALRDYFAAWFSMGLRHPGCYIQATIANTYAYFYPGVLVGNEIQRPIAWIGMEVGAINNGAYQPHYVQPEGLRTAVANAVYATYDMPVLAWLWSPATYVWGLLGSCAYLLHARFVLGRSRDGGASASRKKELFAAAILAVPLLMLLLTTVAGPLNGHLRYVLPLVAALPIVLSSLVVGGSRAGLLKGESSGNGERSHARAVAPAVNPVWNPVPYHARESRVL